MTTIMTMFLWIVFIWCARSAKAMLASTSIPPPEHYHRMARGPVTVEFEYQIEVDGGDQPRTVLQDIDSRILIELQSMMPSNKLFNFSAPLVRTENGSRERPAVEFADISSQVYSPCYTSADKCGLVRSRLMVVFEGEKPKFSINQVAVDFIQRYLTAYEAGHNSTVRISYLYPFYTMTSVQFNISPVADRMTDVEKLVLETSFMDVFAVIVDVVEGDTKILAARYVFQQLTSSSGDDATTATNATQPQGKIRRTRYLQAEEQQQQRPSDMQYKTTANTNSTSSMITLTSKIQILGECRNCSVADFSALINPIIMANLQPFRNKLIENASAAKTNYFDNVTGVKFEIPTLPHLLDPTEHQELYKGLLPSTTKVIFPWFFYLGLSLSFCILVSGGYFIHRELISYEEDDEKDEDSKYSTSSETRDPPSVGSGKSNHSRDDDHTRSSQRSRGATLSTYDIYHRSRGDTLNTFDDSMLNDGTSASVRETTKRNNHRPSKPSSRRLDPTGMIHEYTANDDENADKYSCGEETSLGDFQVKTMLSNAATVVDQRNRSTTNDRSLLAEF